jgi:NAD(P)-dependent dehydrogenase (short-subunit alcohol dehydrogenase family)
LDFDNLNGEKFFEVYNAYAVSKLANVLFSYKLARQLENTGVTVNALHPGVIGIKLLRAGFGIGGGSVKDGAATSVYLASSPEVENLTGKYFVRMKETPLSDISYNMEIQDKMWNISYEMVGLNNK